MTGTVLLFHTLYECMIIVIFLIYKGIYNNITDLLTRFGGLFMTTTKKYLAMQVAKDTGCKKSLASNMVDSVFAAMRSSLIDGNRIEIRGFGVFQVKDTKPIPAARNPRTGEIIYVPARRKTHFKPGKLLKDALHKPLE